MRVLLAVDLSYQTYRAAAAHATLTSADGEFTGGLYGFCATVGKIIRETQATHVVVCEDVKPYRRSELYPQYKMLRSGQGDDELKRKQQSSLVLVRELCHQLGLPVLAVPGFESDDIIAHLVKSQRNRFDYIYAATNDSDIYTLLDIKPLRVYRKDISTVMTRELLLAETGLTPQEFALASALMGTHNDVEGIPRVGPKTAYKAVKDPRLLRMHREQHTKLIERNLRLIQLPYEGFPADLRLPLAEKPFQMRALYRWFARFDITATSSMLEAFEQVLP